MRFPRSLLAVEALSLCFIENRAVVTVTVTNKYYL